MQKTLVRTGRRQNLALLAAGTGLALLIGEGAARMIFPPPLPWRYPQVRYRADPDLVFVLAPNQVAFAADKPVHINSRGLRGPQLDYARRPEPARLLWLGDSIVFGFGVSDEEVVTQRVTVRLQQLGIAAESINMSVPAYNTEQEVSSFSRDGIRYRPDWVIVGACWNDINDQWGARVCPNGWLVQKTAPEESCRPTFSESSGGYAARNAIKRFRLAYGVMEATRSLEAELSPDDHAVFRSEVLEGLETDRVRSGWTREAAAIHRLHELSVGAGFRILVVAFPLPLTLDRSFPKSEYPARLGEIASQERLPFLDLEPGFRRAYHGHDSLFIPYDADHPNAAGHDLAAADIVNFLATRLKTGPTL